MEGSLERVTRWNAVWVGSLERTWGRLSELIGSSEYLNAFERTTLWNEFWDNRSSEKWVRSSDQATGMPEPFSGQVTRAKYHGRSSELSRNWFQTSSTPHYPSLPQSLFNHFYTSIKESKTPLKWHQIFHHLYPILLHPYHNQYKENKKETISHKVAFETKTRRH